MQEELRDRTKAFAVRIVRLLSFTAVQSRRAGTRQAVVTVWYGGGRKLSSGMPVADRKLNGLRRSAIVARGSGRVGLLAGNVVGL